jgi:hypothetical protein
MFSRTVTTVSVALCAAFMDSAINVMDSSVVACPTVDPGLFQNQLVVSANIETKNALEVIE